MLTTRDDAYKLLKRLGAQPHLIRHLELVGEAGDELIELLHSMHVQFDISKVRLGIAVHDAGKIVHPEELYNYGSDHEAAGEALLIGAGVSSEIAQFCVSHAQYEAPDTAFEALLVALADKLWKGKRVSELELKIIDAVAEMQNTDRWAVFDELDSGFEAIAARGDIRLARSII